MKMGVSLISLAKSASAATKKKSQNGCGEKELGSVAWSVIVKGLPALNVSEPSLIHPTAIGSGIGSRIFDCARAGMALRLATISSARPRTTLWSLLEVFMAVVL